MKQSRRDNLKILGLSLLGGLPPFVYNDIDEFKPSDFRDGKMKQGRWKKIEAVTDSSLDMVFYIDGNRYEGRNVILYKGDVLPDEDVRALKVNKGRILAYRMES